MLSLKTALKNAAAKADHSSPLAKSIGWVAGDYATRQKLKREQEINAAFCEREAQIAEETARDMQAAWREYSRQQRREELSTPVYLGM